MKRICGSPAGSRVERLIRGKWRFRSRDAVRVTALAAWLCSEGILNAAPAAPAPGSLEAARQVQGDEPVREITAGLSVNTTDRAESAAFFFACYESSAGVDDGWTGNHGTCDSGATRDEFKQAVLLRVNYFRAMAGVPADIAFLEEYSSKCQEAALMLSANGVLSHYPPLSWQCYTTNGALAAQNANISTACGSEAISCYIEDPGSENGPVNHRRWILYPQTKHMGTGDIPAVGAEQSANALWVVDTENYWNPRPATRDDFVAWPPPGYVPHVVVYPRWSFSYPGADFSRVQINVTEDGRTIYGMLESLQYGTGENTFVWAPNASCGANHPPSRDVVYTVSLRNVVVSGVARSFNYQVTVFNPYQGQTAWDDGYMDLGGGWRRLSWFGDYQSAGGGWIWHGEHGWLYCVGTAPTSIWLWSSRIGWLWTCGTGYPFLWSDDSSAWLWYFKTSGNGTGGWFYNYGTGRAEWR